MWSIEQSRVGRIVVPDAVPPGFALFYTTVDHRGRIDDEVAAALTSTSLEQFGVDMTLATCHQVHGATIVRAQRENRWRECDSCDALFTDERHVGLGIKVADCLPISMIDPTHSVIANVHSGWRGAVQRIAAEAIDGAQRVTAFRPEDAVVFLGPSIRICCFEVGEEVVEALEASYGDVEPYVDRRAAKPHVDLPGLTAALLRERGIAPDAIHDSGLCTRCEGSMFHSYRRDRESGGRNLVVVAQ
ncbi:MAG: peptidoglycan editing factor PgeF [Thermoanaerobaculia bacterium]